MKRNTTIPLYFFLALFTLSLLTACGARKKSCAAYDSIELQQNVELNPTK